jgi:hypothetical protein
VTQPRVAGSDQSVTNREVDVIDVERKYPMQPMNGKNLWRLTEFYGRLIGVPELKPHDLSHGVAMDAFAEIVAIIDGLTSYNGNLVAWHALVSTPTVDARDRLPDSQIPICERVKQMRKERRRAVGWMAATQITDSRKSPATLRCGTTRGLGLSSERRDEHGCNARDERTALHYSIT